MAILGSRPSSSAFAFAYWPISTPAFLLSVAYSASTALCGSGGVSSAITVTPAARGLLDRRARRPWSPTGTIRMPLAPCVVMFSSAVTWLALSVSNLPAAVSSSTLFSFAAACAASFIFTKKGLVSVFVIRPTVTCSSDDSALPPPPPPELSSSSPQATTPSPSTATAPSVAIRNDTPPRRERCMRIPLTSIVRSSSPQPARPPVRSAQDGSLLHPVVSCRHAPAGRGPRALYAATANVCQARYCVRRAPHPRKSAPHHAGRRGAGRGRVAVDGVARPERQPARQRGHAAARLGGRRPAPVPAEPRGQLAPAGGHAHGRPRGARRRATRSSPVR